MVGLTLLTAVLITLRYLRHGMPFNLGWWGFTFPLGVYALATLKLAAWLGLGFFTVMGHVLVVALVALWLLVAVYFAVMLAVNTLAFWMPTLIHGAGIGSDGKVGLLSAERDPGMLFELARGRLEQVQVEAPVRGFRLSARDLPSFVPQRRELFDERPQQSLPWEQLRERLRARLGDDAVYRVTPAGDPRPERAWRRVEGDGARIGPGNELRAGARVWPGVELPATSVRFSTDA